jgi:hypothetical protein
LQRRQPPERKGEEREWKKEGEPEEIWKEHIVV